jgi:predicted acetyltransferase
MKPEPTPFGNSPAPSPRVSSKCGESAESYTRTTKIPESSTLGVSATKTTCPREFYRDGWLLGDPSRDPALKTIWIIGNLSFRECDEPYLNLALKEGKLSRMTTGVELIPAGAEHQAALGNLLELYSHDFSELVPIDVGDDGRYGYKSLPLYWSDHSRLPFLASLDGKLVGFVLVTRSPGPSGDGYTWDMAEFFVMRRYRHRGVGTELATQVWLRCPGRWQIRVMESNLSARKFWDSSISAFTGLTAVFTNFVTDGVTWYRFSFDSRR